MPIATFTPRHFGWGRGEVNCTMLSLQQPHMRRVVYHQQSARCAIMRHMINAFVTGANGFIGSALVRRLLNDGVVVRALCRESAKGQDIAAQGAKIVVGDIRDLSVMRRAIEG